MVISPIAVTFTLADGHLWLPAHRRFARQVGTDIT